MGRARGLQAKRGVNARAKKGRGSWSGKNRWAMGGLDDEIAELSPERKERAGVKAKREIWDEEDRTKLVSYVLDPVRWPNFKINQAQIFGEVSFVALIPSGKSFGSFSYSNEMKVAQYILRTKSQEQVCHAW